MFLPCQARFTGRSVATFLARHPTILHVSFRELSVIMNKVNRAGSHRPPAFFHQALTKTRSVGASAACVPVGVYADASSLDRRMCPPPFQSDVSGMGRPPIDGRWMIPTTWRETVRISRFLCVLFDPFAPPDHRIRDARPGTHSASTKNTCCNGAAMVLRH